MGLSMEVRFKRAVVGLWRLGVYPGPTALNLVIHGRNSNNINGRECKWRREVMFQRGIPFQRPNSCLAAMKQMRGEPR